MPQLGGRTAADFLQSHWQRKPLLVRNAFPDLSDPVSPEEVAGLALEDDVSSRLVQQTDPNRPDGWRVAYGPFEEAHFTALPEHRWTVLVQRLNELIPEAAALLNRFRFLPNWQVDDLMVSYAAVGGSVGPHLDRYDVFLIQGQGQRRWQIGEKEPDDCPYERVAGIELDVLADFHPTDEWVLHPGDLLYLPPGVPHHGVAVTPCLTYSVGFRMPTERELLIGLLEDSIANDTNSGPAKWHPSIDQAVTDPGLISADSLAHMRAALRQLLADDSALNEWFGRFITRAPDGLPAVDEGHREGAHAADELQRHPAVRWSYQTDDRGLVLYADGNRYRPTETSGPVNELIPLLCGQQRLTTSVMSAFLADFCCARLLDRLQQDGLLHR